MTLDLAEALYRVGCLPSEGLQALASGLLAQGEDTPALRRLAGMSEQDLDKAAECFAHVLDELGRTRLTKQDAVLRLARDLAIRVLAGTVEKRTAAELGARYARASEVEELLLPLLLAEDEYDSHGPTLADARVEGWARGILDTRRGRVP